MVKSEKPLELYSRISRGDLNHKPDPGKKKLNFYTQVDQSGSCFSPR